MIFNSIQSERYDVCLINPFRNAKTNIKNRSGLYVRLFIDDFCGCGEAAPLSPYSNETLAEISWAFEELKIALKDNSHYLKDDLLDLFELYARDMPSLHFALDISLYDIMAQKEKISLAKYLNFNNLNEVKFSSVYNGAINKSFKKVKVKFGLNDIDKEINFLYELFNQYNNKVQFRIDANQAYSIDEFLYLLNEIKKINIEYIEEPLSNLNQENLESIKRISDIPIAIDESIFSSNYKALSESHLIDYAIIKPSLYGGLNSIFKLVNFFKRHDIKIIFSSALNTKIGNLSNIHLASALKLNNCHGLNEHAFFRLGQMPYGPNDSTIKVDKLEGLGVCENE
tara:strand:- start:7921 stop:8943 length:1023 start_codon:yes stop_codon:yes gene_type:complete